MFLKVPLIPQIFIVCLILHMFADFKRDLYKYSLEYTKRMVDAVLEAKEFGASGLDKLQQLLSDHEDTKYNELQVE